MSDRILGYTWSEIQRLQQRQFARPSIDTSRPGDYGSDPLGNGAYRMVPSGDVVDLVERNRRLGAQS